MEPDNLLGSTQNLRTQKAAPWCGKVRRLLGGKSSGVKTFNDFPTPVGGILLIQMGVGFLPLSSGSKDMVNQAAKRGFTYFHSE
ncbi:hypothetical protein SCA6_004861 [Theobroma cacao]